MFLMNWHSVGFKVVAINMTIVTLLSLVFLLYFAQLEKQKLIERKIEYSRQLLLISESVRDDSIRKWENKLYSPEQIIQIAQNNSPAMSKELIISMVPVASAWNVIEAKAQEGGFRFKAPAFNPRNPARNSPDEYESQVLDKFKSNPALSEYSIIDEENQEIRYFRPVKIVKQCELCHGNPNTSQSIWGNANGQDILGYPMENLHSGDLRGAFEIITPFSVAFTELKQTLYYAITFLCITLFIIGASGYLVISKIIINPLTDLALNLQSISSGEGNLRARLTASGKSEFAWVAASFNAFVKKIATTVEKISETSDKLANASNKLATITQTTQHGVERQLQETTLVANAMRQMISTVQEVTRNAVKASEAAEIANIEASTGKSIVNQAVDGIN